MSLASVGRSIAVLDVSRVVTQVLADAPHGRTRDADGAIVVFVPFDERNDAVTVATRYEGE